LEVEEISLVDFVGVYNILSNSLDNGVHMKIALSQFVVKNFQDDTHILVVIKGELFMLGCYIILLLKRKGWKGLTSHPRDQGKDHHNVRTNYL
jgi:hypothetical protein